MKKVSKYGGRWLIGTVLIAVVTVIMAIIIGVLYDPAGVIEMKKAAFKSYQGFIIIPSVVTWLVYTIWYWKNIFSKNDLSDSAYKGGRTGIIAISVVLSAVLDVVAIMVNQARNMESLILCVALTIVFHLIAAILAPVLMGSRK